MVDITKIRKRCSCLACSSSVLLSILEGQGKKVPAFSGCGSVLLDDVLFKNGQAFFKTNFFSIFLAHLIGLVSLLRIESILRVLRLTEKSNTSSKAFVRYFGTLVHLKRWYETDIYDDAQSGFRSLQEVRRKHSQSQANSRRLLALDISQSDMVYTQWAFVAPVVLEPTKLGIKYSPKGTMEGFVYFWKAIGNIMGLQERFNLCQGTLEDVQRECTAILHQIIQPNTLCPPEHSDAMAITMLEGMTHLIPMIEKESFIRYTAYFLGVPTSKPTRKWQNTVKMWILEKGYHIPLLGDFLRCLFNILLRFSIFVKSSFQRWKEVEHILYLPFKNASKYMKITWSYRFLKLGTKKKLI